MRTPGACRERKGAGRAGQMKVQIGGWKERARTNKETARYGKRGTEEEGDGERRLRGLAVKSLQECEREQKQLHPPHNTHSVSQQQVLAD